MPLMSLTSLRPVSVMARELMGFDGIFVMYPYSDEWRDQRKLFIKYFRSPGSAGPGVHTLQAYEFVSRFLVELNETPREVFSLARQ